MYVYTSKVYMHGDSLAWDRRICCFACRYTDLEKFKFTYEFDFAWHSDTLAYGAQ